MGLPEISEVTFTCVYLLNTLHNISRLSCGITLHVAMSEKDKMVICEDGPTIWSYEGCFHTTWNLITCKSDFEFLVRLRH